MTETDIDTDEQDLDAEHDLQDLLDDGDGPAPARPPWHERVPTWAWLLAGAILLVGIVGGLLELADRSAVPGPGDESAPGSVQVTAEEREQQRQQGGVSSATGARYTWNTLPEVAAGSETCSIRPARLTFTVPQGWQAQRGCSRVVAPGNDAALPITITTTPASEGDLGSFDRRPLDGTFLQQARLNLPEIFGTRTEIIPDSGYPTGTHIVRWHVPSGDVTVTITSPGTQEQPDAPAAGDAIVTSMRPARS